MSKWVMSDASLKRMVKKLFDIRAEEPASSRPTMDDVLGVLRAEGFDYHPIRCVPGVFRYLAENPTKANLHILVAIASSASREYGELHEARNNLHGALQQMGIVPTPEATR